MSTQSNQQVDNVAADCDCAMKILAIKHKEQINKKTIQLNHQKIIRKLKAGGWPRSQATVSRAKDFLLTKDKSTFVHNCQDIQDNLLEILRKCTSKPTQETMESILQVSTTTTNLENDDQHETPNLLRELHEYGRILKFISKKPNHRCNSTQGHHFDLTVEYEENATGDKENKAYLHTMLLPRNQQISREFISGLGKQMQKTLLARYPALKALLYAAAPPQPTIRDASSQPIIEEVATQEEQPQSVIQAITEAGEQQQPSITNQ